MKNLLQTLEQYKEDGLLYSQVHPTLPLTIWNYTPKTQYEALWDDITLMCRGLVTDDKGVIVARPFKKFFNIEEERHTPTNEFEVFDKLDGSLIIIFWYNDQMVIASRGSFTSDHVGWATQILEEKYPNLHKILKKEFTHCFELIYPENRIVVDYGDRKDIILTSIFHTENGTECSFNTINHLPISVVKSYEGLDWQNIKVLNWKNSEGFVVRFSNGDRCKIKFEDYIRLHRVMTNISERKIWKALSEGQPITSILENVPDEFYDEVELMERNLTDKFMKTKKLHELVFEALETEDRKEFAKKVMGNKGVEWYNPSILFAMLDGRNYDQIIWKMIKP